MKLAQIPAPKVKKILPTISGTIFIECRAPITLSVYLFGNWRECIPTKMPSAISVVLAHMVLKHDVLLKSLGVDASKVVSCGECRWKSICDGCLVAPLTVLSVHRVAL
jgi:hypothetical protein